MREEETLLECCSEWNADWACIQFNFRMNALAGLIPGVKKASW